MADRELRYGFYKIDADGSSEMVFTDVDHAKTEIGFTGLDLTKGTPGWTLENDNKRLVLTWVFTDAQADDQLTTHNQVKDTWTPSNSGKFDPSYSHYKAWGNIQS